ncbi:hypothetical protein ERO13_D01G219050v2 [Gossypium hirsutum]|nr:hypothetical protein ERO13_D01G219050v2 [Gossypium hirsutum]
MKLIYKICLPVPFSLQPLLYTDGLCRVVSSSRLKEPPSINIVMCKSPFLKLTLGNILEGTSHFCKANIIGDGHFGSCLVERLIHKGALDVFDWSKCFKIAIGAAQGLEFLHHAFIPRIIQRDIKASNI